MADEESQKNPENIEFKKPVLIGRVGKLPKRADSEQASQSGSKSVSSQENVTVRNKLVPGTETKAGITPFPYREPKWSGLCPDGSAYALEILKSGMILERVDLTNQPFYVFGRLPNSHIVLSHPTSSRHHAVLQYKAFAVEGEPPSGWYLYDLGSTHGTFLNGVRLKHEYYCRVRVGHQVKFGTSTRTYIVMGPDYDCEGESDLTVTEIKQKAQELKLAREKMLQEVMAQKERDRLEAEKKREEQGIDWGMGEDAEEDPDLADNPYAATANEELYLEDPKKTLRGYFEREGHELSYDCEERGVGQFLCRVELPLDDARGRPVVAEVLHRGKKKEAVVACALEACRLLDRAGLLRQAKHESRRRKERDWGADDYYDSDEDTFLDRTGSVETKRRRRMRAHGALPAARQLRTFDDLWKDIAEIERKIETEENILERLRRSGRQVAEERSDEDALDEYMNSLRRHRHTMAQKAEISNAKLAIQKLKTELLKTQRLAELARPADAPPLVKKDDKRLVKLSNSVVYGKRMKLKEDKDKKPKLKQEIKVEETEFVEEMDSDEEEKPSVDSQIKKEECSPTTVVKEMAVMGEAKQVEVEDNTTVEDSRKEKHKDNCEPDSQEVIEKNYSVHKTNQNKDLSMETNSEVNTKEGIEGIQEHTQKAKQKHNTKTDDSTEVKRVFGPMRPPENYVIPEDYFDQETDRDLPEIEESDTM